MGMRKVFARILSPLNKLGIKGRLDAVISSMDKGRKGVRSVVEWGRGESLR